MSRARSDVARSAPKRSSKHPQREALTEREPRDADDILVLQRAVGNRAVQRLLEGRPRHGSAASSVPVVQREPGQLDEFDDDFDEADEVDDDAEYLYDPARNPHTLGMYLLPALAAAGAKAASREQQEAEAKLKDAAEAKDKQEAAAKAKEEAEAKARQAAEAQARLEEEARQAAEAKARQEAEERAKEAAEAQARLEEEARAKEAAEAQARAEAEAKAKEAAEAKAREAAEAKARLEEEARQAAEAKAKQEAEEQARQAAEAQARLEEEARQAAEAEAQARKEAAAKAKEEAAAKAKAEAKAKAAQEELAKKAEIRAELEKKLMDRFRGTPVDQWAKLTTVQQDGFVQQVFNQKATPTAYQVAKTAAAELAKAAIRAEKDANLQDDKAWLNRAVDALQASAEIKEIFRAAIAFHRYGDDSYGLTIEKAYSVSTIVEACWQWGVLQKTQVTDPAAAVANRRVPVENKLKVMSNLHSPGWQETEIKWKPRGENSERTRNLIALVDGLKSNVHVHPPGGWKKKL